MKLHANSAKVQYAVIRASGAHDSPDLLVLAYADEKLLRSLIAEPSIMALGFPSRSEAHTAVVGRLQQSVSTQRMHEISARRNVNHRFWLSLHFSRRRLTDALTCWKSHSTVYRAIQFTFATAVVVFHSRNIVCATIRTALGV